MGLSIFMEFLAPYISNFKGKSTSERAELINSSSSKSTGSTGRQFGYVPPHVQIASKIYLTRIM